MHSTSKSMLYEDKLDGLRFLLETKFNNQFQVGTGDIGDRLEVREVVCNTQPDNSLNWTEKEWELLLFTGKIGWYIGAGWSTVGEFKDGILQNKLEWVDSSEI